MKAIRRLGIRRSVEVWRLCEVLARLLRSFIDLDLLFRIVNSACVR